MGPGVREDRRGIANPYFAVSSQGSPPGGRVRPRRIVHQSSVHYLLSTPPFPDVEDGKRDGADEYDPLESGNDRIPQCQTAQKDNPGSQEVEDNRSCEGDAVLAAVGEDDPRQKHADDEKDGEPEDLVDGVRTGCIEVDQKDRDGKDTVGHLIGKGSSPFRPLLSLLPRLEDMVKDTYGVWVDQAFLSSIPHQNIGDYCGDRQWQGKNQECWYREVACRDDESGGDE